MTNPRIVASRKPLDATRVRAAAPGWNSIEVVETTGSTNADLRKQAALGQVADLSALIASEQTAGRGRDCLRPPGIAKWRVAQATRLPAEKH